MASRSPYPSRPRSSSSQSSSSLPGGKDRFLLSHLSSGYAEIRCLPEALDISTAAVRVSFYRWIDAGQVRPAVTDFDESISEAPAAPTTRLVSATGRISHSVAPCAQRATLALYRAAERSLHVHCIAPPTGVVLGTTRPRCRRMGRAPSSARQPQGAGSNC